MSDSKLITKTTYEQGLDTYIANTPTVVGPEYKPFLNTFAKLVGTQQVLEVGSAVGRDADYLECKGVPVFRTDYAISFVEYLRAQGKEAQQFDVINDDLGRQFAGVIANAVFLHFTNEDFEKALENVQCHLLPHGYFAISVKAGEGEEVTNEKMDAPRYFNYWQPDDLEAILQAHDYSILHTFRPGNGKWIQLITQSIRV